MIGLACFLLLPILLCGSSSFRGGGKVLILVLFCGSACMAPLASTWFGFVIWAELASISLAMLIAFTDRFAARLYLYLQIAAGGILLLGSALMSTPSALAPLGPVSEKALPFFLVALGMKCAFPLLHFWLPRTYEHAPAEALLLSSYTATMGIYGLLRLLTEPSRGIMITGAIMALYGAFQALMQSRPRRILAYSTMSQLGFVVTALATGTLPGRAAAIFFAVVHVLSKGLLFCSTEKALPFFMAKTVLGNLRAYRRSLFFFVLGALSMVGFPGTAGYLAKKAVLSSLDFSPVFWALQLAGLGTMLYLCKLGHVVFFAPSCGEESPEKTRQTPVQSFSFPGDMILLGTPLFFLGMSPESAFILSFSPEILRNWSSLGIPVLLLGGSLGLFFLLRKIPGFLMCSFPDVDLLAYRACFLGKPGMEALRKMHSGKLRLSFAFFGAALVGIFFLFSL